jgi:hypothetical protein
MGEGANPELVVTADRETLQKISGCSPTSTL